MVVGWRTARWGGVKGGALGNHDGKRRATKLLIRVEQVGAGVGGCSRWGRVWVGEGRCNRRHFVGVEGSEGGERHAVRCAERGVGTGGLMGRVRRRGEGPLAARSSSVPWWWSAAGWGVRKGALVRFKGSTVALR